MKTNKNIMKDMYGRTISIGHIVAVRYSWNSYVGVARLKGLCAEGSERHAFFSPHSFKETSTYQILGHVYKEHPDFNEGVFNWFTTEDGELPADITIDVYKNIEVTP